MNERSRFEGETFVDNGTVHFFSFFSSFIGSTFVVEEIEWSYSTEKLFEP